MSSSFRGDVGKLIRDRAFIGYVLCQVLASQIIFTFAGGGPYIVVTQMGRTTRRIWRMVRDNRICLSGRQPVLRALRAAPFAGEADLVRAGAAIRRRAC